MPTIYTKDSLRAAVEAASGGHRTVLYDVNGNPSIMHVIPKFTVKDVLRKFFADDTAWNASPFKSIENSPHPAFVKGGVERPEMYVGCYLGTVRDGLVCSLPNEDPTASITFDAARAACVGKGAGWHLMTNWEWAALLLWCQAAGTPPRGNNDYGRNYDAGYEVGVRVDGGTPGNTSGTARTRTGSGPAAWNHDASPTGIADLVGNCAEWVDGLKLVDGKILMPVDNNIGLAEASWPDSGYRIDATTEGDASSGTGSIGDPVLSNAVTRYAGPQGDDAMYAYTSLTNWTALTAKSGMTVPASLVLAGIAPLPLVSGAYDTPPAGYFYTRNYGTRLPIRGGYWTNRGGAGLAALYLSFPRSSASGHISFRPAFLG